MKNWALNFMSSLFSLNFRLSTFYFELFFINLKSTFCVGFHTFSFCELSPFTLFLCHLNKKQKISTYAFLHVTKWFIKSISRRLYLISHEVNILIIFLKHCRHIGWENLNYPYKMLFIFLINMLILFNQFASSIFLYL